MSEMTRRLCAPLQDRIFHFTHHPAIQYFKGCKYDFFQEHTSNIRERFLLKSRHDWCQLCGDSIEEGKWAQCTVSNSMFCLGCTDCGAAGCLHCELLDRAKRLALEKRLAEEEMLDEMADGSDIDDGNESELKTHTRSFRQTRFLFF